MEFTTRAIEFAPEGSRPLHAVMAESLQTYQDLQHLLRQTSLTAEERSVVWSDDLLEYE